MVYGHASGETIDEAVASVAHYLELGYRAVRAQCSVPGVSHTYGIGKGGHYEPAVAGALTAVDVEHRALPGRPWRRSSSDCAGSSGRPCTCCTTSTIG